MTIRLPSPLCVYRLGRNWIDKGTNALTQHSDPRITGAGLFVGIKTKRVGITEEVDLPKNINGGLTAPTPDFLASLLGMPRKNFSGTCQPITDKSLASQIQLSNVGRFKVQGLKLAVSCLKRIMNRIKNEFPFIYCELGSAGMLCCRQQRGSNKISSHSWGTAIDLTLCGQIDKRGNRKVQYGLTLIAPIFKENGWVWGAAYRTEDGMHFEISKEKILEWQSQGLIKALTASGRHA